MGYFEGGNGNDTLAGTTSDDVLIANIGDDVLWGGGGNDSLIAANRGRNNTAQLYGNGGNDVFEISFGYDANQDSLIEIKDYTSEDSIDFIQEANSEGEFRELHDIHLGTGNGNSAVTFIYNESNKILATIVGTEHYFIPEYQP